MEMHKTESCVTNDNSSLKEIFDFVNKSRERELKLIETVNEQSKTIESLKHIKDINISKIEELDKYKEFYEKVSFFMRNTSCQDRKTREGVIKLLMEVEET